MIGNWHGWFYEDWIQGYYIYCHRKGIWSHWHQHWGKHITVPKIKWLFQKCLHQIYCLEGFIKPFYQWIDKSWCLLCYSSLASSWKTPWIVNSVLAGTVLWARVSRSKLHARPRPHSTCTTVARSQCSSSSAERMNKTYWQFDDLIILKITTQQLLQQRVNHFQTWVRFAMTFVCVYVRLVLVKLCFVK